jgi:hypothetical protein
MMIDAKTWPMHEALRLLDICVLRSAKLILVLRVDQLLNEDV